MLIQIQNLIRQQFINFLIYTTIGVSYGFYIHPEGLTYITPIFIFSCLLFIFSVFLIYYGQMVFKKMNLVIYLIPQLIGLLILISITVRNWSIGYFIGYGIDGILWGFLVVSTLLNIRTYYSTKEVKIYNTD
jgi:hypothetical protein